MSKNGKKTLCWDCGKAAGRCSWSRDLTPVKGWKAEKDKRNGDETFLVIECPLYEKMHKTDIGHKEAENLMYEIAKQAILDYRKALMKEAKAHRDDPALDTKRKLYRIHHRKLYGHPSIPYDIKDVERFLRSEYGKAMIGDLEPDDIINRIRRECLQGEVPALTGKQMRAIRRKLGMTMEEMAKACGCSDSYICDLENGRAHAPMIARRILALAEREEV